MRSGLGGLVASSFFSSSFSFWFARFVDGGSFFRGERKTRLEDGRGFSVCLVYFSFLFFYKNKSFSEQMGLSLSRRKRKQLLGDCMLRGVNVRSPNQDGKEICLEVIVFYSDVLR